MYQYILYRYILGKMYQYIFKMYQYTFKIYQLWFQNIPVYFPFFQYIFKIYRYILGKMYQLWFQNIPVYFQNILVYFPQVLVWLLVDNTCLKTPSKNVLERHTNEWHDNSANQNVQVIYFEMKFEAKTFGWKVRDEEFF